MNSQLKNDNKGVTVSNKTRQQARKNLKMDEELLEALKAKAKSKGYKSLVAYFRALVK